MFILSHSSGQITYLLLNLVASWARGVPQVNWIFWLEFIELAEPWSSTYPMLFPFLCQYYFALLSAISASLYLVSHLVVLFYLIAFFFFFLSLIFHFTEYTDLALFVFLEDVHCRYKYMMWGWGRGNPTINFTSKDNKMSKMKNRNVFVIGFLNPRTSEPILDLTSQAT